MIICSCNVISDSDLEKGIALLKDKHPQRTPTVGSVYKALGKQLNCGGCIPIAVMKILEMAPRPNQDRPSRPHVCPQRRTSKRSALPQRRVDLT